MLSHDFSILSWKYICMLTIIKSTFVSFYNPSLSFYTAQLLIILHYPFLGVQQIKILFESTVGLFAFANVEC